MKQLYQELEFTDTISGDLLKTKDPFVNVLRVYFIRFTKESSACELDLTDVYCIHGDTKSVEKCQVKMVAPNAQEPTLRFLRNGQVLLDDEITAPSFFQLNQEWWTQRTIQEEIVSRAKRTERYMNIKIRRELQTDTADWQGPNIGFGVDDFLQGGDYTRHLNELGSHLTSTMELYGDRGIDTFDIPHAKLDAYIARLEQEEKLIGTAGLRDPWGELEKMVRGHELTPPQPKGLNKEFSVRPHPQDELDPLEIIARSTVEEEFSANIANYEEYETEADMEFDLDLEISEDEIIGSGSDN
jgi:hypothetical protein